MSLIFKFVNSIFAILFFASAGLQFNDPDPIHWIFLYGLAAVLCSFAVFGKLIRPWIFISLGAVILQLLILSDGAYLWFKQGMENMLIVPMSKDKPYIEEIREFFGTLIVFSANLFLLYQSQVQKK